MYCILVYFFLVLNLHGSTLNSRSDTLFTLTYSNEEHCNYCLEQCSSFPTDFNVDINKNIYMLDFCSGGLTKYNCNGLKIWMNEYINDKFSRLHYYKGKLYLSDGINIAIYDTSDGTLIENIKLHTDYDSLYIGDNIYFFQDKLFVKYKCDNKYANASSVLIFEINSGILYDKIICANYGYANSQDRVVFWPTLDNIDYSSYLGEFTSASLLGQSKKYLIYSIEEQDNNINRLSMCIFDKTKKRVYTTSLGDYYAEPYDSRQFKFLDNNKAVIQQVIYANGEPDKINYILLTFYQ